MGKRISRLKTGIKQYPIGKVREDSMSEKNLKPKREDDPIEREIEQDIQYRILHGKITNIETRIRR